MKKLNIYLSLFAVAAAVTCLCSCKKLVEVPPPIQNIIGDQAYNSDKNAISVLNGIYMDMVSSSIFTGRSSITIGTGLYADELNTVADDNDILTSLYFNSLTNDDGGFWTNLYAYIFRVNSAIEGVTASDRISANVKNQLLGEAKFLRSYYYFNLVNLCGDVPYLTSTDIKLNTTPSRTAKDEIYNSIIEDLKEAKEKLSENYVGTDGLTPIADRTRPNKAVATALLARVYLYSQDWANAESESSQLISNNVEYNLPGLSVTFLSDSKEAIWQLQPVGVLDKNTFDALVFILEGNGGVLAGPNGSTRPVYLSDQLINSFEPNDQRKVEWIDSVEVSGIQYYYPFKYRQWIADMPRTEFLMMFRLAEQYLIRAEARAQQNKLTGSGSAIEDIDVVRSRAGLVASGATTKEDILNAIIQERKVELFTESGHRWFDLKHMGVVNAVMDVVSPIKGSSWSSYKSLFPIPVSEIKRNPNLREQQNPGYPEN